MTMSSGITKLYLPKNRLAVKRNIEITTKNVFVLISFVISCSAVLGIWSLNIIMVRPLSRSFSLKLELASLASAQPSSKKKDDATVFDALVPRHHLAEKEKSCAEASA